MYFYGLGGGKLKDRPGHPPHTLATQLGMNILDINQWLITLCPTTHQLTILFTVQREFQFVRSGNKLQIRSSIDLIHHYTTNVHSLGLES